MVCKYIERLAKKYMLDVKVIQAKGDYGRRYKVYKFTGNFLANFSALAKEASERGYVIPSDYGQGHLVKSR